MRSHLLLLILGASLLAGCAAKVEEAPMPSFGRSPGPAMDGGIVGTGNQPNCEPRKDEDGNDLPLPPECVAR